MVFVRIPEDTLSRGKQRSPSAGTHLSSQAAWPYMVIQTALRVIGWAGFRVGSSDSPLPIRTHLFRQIHHKQAINLYDTQEHKHAHSFYNDLPPGDVAMD